MKLFSKALVLCAAVLSVSTSFAKVGTHNFTISVGGNFNIGNLRSGGAFDFEGSGSSDLNFLGGGYQIDIGHLNLKGDKLVQGYDTRISVGQNFTGYTKLDGEKVVYPEGTEQGLAGLYVNFGSTYQLGRRLKGSRLMFDVIGLNIGYYTGMEVTKVGPLTTKVATGGALQFGLNLPLGINYIADNGFMIGFRHRIDFIMGGRPVVGSPEANGSEVTIPMESGSLFGLAPDQALYLDYNMTFSLGYAIGK